MSDVIEQLLKLRHSLTGGEPNFLEVYAVQSFRCHRKKKNGETQRVSVELLDAGSTSAPGLRYSCRAVGDDGARAAGSPQPTIEHALAVVHWGDLDGTP